MILACGNKVDGAQGEWKVKRVFDFLVCVIGLVLAVPLIIVLVVVIRWQTGSSGIFSQIRVGRDGRVFFCHKLRTMRAETPNVPTHLAAVEQVTRIGRFLRRAKLDELPQLWNVLKGEMSLVGPRPCLPTQVELVEERRSRGVLALRPGITGLAQVRGIDMSTPVRLAETDEEYLRRRSFVLDLKIMVSTIVSASALKDRVRGSSS